MAAQLYNLAELFLLPLTGISIAAISIGWNCVIFCLMSTVILLNSPLLKVISFHLITGKSAVTPIYMCIGLFYCVHLAVLAFSPKPERLLVGLVENDIEKELLGGRNR